MDLSFELQNQTCLGEQIAQQGKFVQQRQDYQKLGLNENHNNKDNQQNNIQNQIDSDKNKIKIQKIRRDSLQILKKNNKDKVRVNFGEIDQYDSGLSFQESFSGIQQKEQQQEEELSFEQQNKTKLIDSVKLKKQKVKNGKQKKVQIKFKDEESWENQEDISQIGSERLFHDSIQFQNQNLKQNKDSQQNYENSNASKKKVFENNFDSAQKLEEMFRNRSEGKDLQNNKQRQQEDLNKKQPKFKASLNNSQSFKKNNSKRSKLEVKITNKIRKDSFGSSDSQLNKNKCQNYQYQQQQQQIDDQDFTPYLQGTKENLNQNYEIICNNEQNNTSNSQKGILVSDKKKRESKQLIQKNLDQQNSLQQQQDSMQLSFYNFKVSDQKINNQIDQNQINEVEKQKKDKNQNKKKKGVKFEECSENSEILKIETQNSQEQTQQINQINLFGFKQKDSQEDSFNNKKNLQQCLISQEKEKELEKEKQIYKAQTLSSYMENIMEYDDTQGVHLQNQSPLKYKRQFSKNKKSYDQFSDPIYSGDVSFDEEIEQFDIQMKSQNQEKKKNQEIKFDRKTSLDVQKNFQISGNNKNEKKNRQQIYGQKQKQYLSQNLNGKQKIQRKLKQGDDKSRKSKILQLNQIQFDQEQVENDIQQIGQQIRKYSNNNFNEQQSQLEQKLLVNENQKQEWVSNVNKKDDKKTPILGTYKQRIQAFNGFFWQNQNLESSQINQYLEEIKVKNFQQQGFKTHYYKIGQNIKKIEKQVCEDILDGKIKIEEQKSLQQQQLKSKKNYKKSVTINLTDQQNQHVNSDLKNNQSYSYKQGQDIIDNTQAKDKFCDFLQNMNNFSYNSNVYKNNNQLKNMYKSQQASSKKIPKKQIKGGAIRMSPDQISLKQKVNQCQNNDIQNEAIRYRNSIQLIKKLQLEKQERMKRMERQRAITDHQKQIEVEKKKQEQEKIQREKREQIKQQHQLTLQKIQQRSEERENQRKLYIQKLKEIKNSSPLLGKKFGNQRKSQNQIENQSLFNLNNDNNKSKSIHNNNSNNNKKSFISEDESIQSHENSQSIINLNNMSFQSNLGKSKQKQGQKQIYQKYRYINESREIGKKYYKTKISEILEKQEEQDKLKQIMEKEQIKIQKEKEKKYSQKVQERLKKQIERKNQKQSLCLQEQSNQFQQHRSISLYQQTGQNQNKSFEKINIYDKKTLYDLNNSQKKYLGNQYMDLSKEMGRKNKENEIKKIEEIEKKLKKDIQQSRITQKYKNYMPEVRLIYKKNNIQEIMDWQQDLQNRNLQKDQKIDNIYKKTQEIDFELKKIEIKNQNYGNYYSVNNEQVDNMYVNSMKGKLALLEQLQQRK